MPSCRQPPVLTSSCADRLPEPLHPAIVLQPQQESYGTDLTIMNDFIDMNQIRLPLQAAPHRRLRCRKVLLAPAIRRRHLHRVLYFHNRCRLRTLWSSPHPRLTPLTLWQKIRTIELDGKTVKLQIVSQPESIPNDRHGREPKRQQLTRTHRHTVGHRRTRAFPNHHLFLLPRCPRHLRRLRCHRHGFVQQREAMATGDRQIRH